MELLVFIGVLMVEGIVLICFVEVDGVGDGGVDMPASLSLS
jgi:hypothetical protein